MTDGMFVAGGATDGTMGSGAATDGTVVVGEVVVGVPNSSLLKGDPGALESTGGVLDCGWPGIREAGREGGGRGVVAPAV